MNGVFVRLAIYGRRSILIINVTCEVVIVVIGQGARCEAPLDLTVTSFWPVVRVPDRWDAAHIVHVHLGAPSETTTTRDCGLQAVKRHELAPMHCFTAGPN